MELTYDIIESAFLSKVTEYEFLHLPPEIRQTLLDDCMKRAVVSFKKVCSYDLSNTDDDNRTFNTEVDNDDIDEIIEIISEGMLVQWLKPYVYKQELLESVLNTSDFSTYSPAEMLLRVRETYSEAQRVYSQMIKEYSYNHNDLTDLHS